jgi:hypothetical protein
VHLPAGRLDEIEGCFRCRNTAPCQQLPDYDWGPDFSGYLGSQRRFRRDCPAFGYSPNLLVRRVSCCISNGSYVY